MDYSETTEWLFSRLPSFQREGASAYKVSLDNSLELDNRFGHPHKVYRTIHVAGTNGKGSVAHMIASILQESGLKTGLYTSPHLKDFRERIKINGTMIPKEYVTGFVEENKEYFERLKPSFFEMTSTMAFTWFAREHVDIAVIETGLGGRLDSTNIITPVISVITNIDYDHTALLGNTLEKIAFEKAGIIKQNIPAVIGTEDPAYARVFMDKAEETHSPLTFASKEWEIVRKQDRKFDVRRKDGKMEFMDLECGLAGEYQTENIPTVLETIYTISKYGGRCTEECIRKGIARVVDNTGLQGRWQTISADPLTICDTGHNPAGFRHIVRQLAEYSRKDLRIVIGMVNDKDVDGVLEQLPKDAVYYFCKASIPRALDENILFEKAQKHGLTGKAYPSVSAAAEAAKKDSDKNDVIYIGGSTFVVAEII